MNDRHAPPSVFRPTKLEQSMRQVRRARADVHAARDADAETDEQLAELDAYYAGRLWAFGICTAIAAIDAGIAAVLAVADMPILATMLGVSVGVFGIRAWDLRP